MKINQLNFSYSPHEDRLLFRFNTLSRTEFRMWLTRAISIRLLDVLQQAAKISLLREQPEVRTVAAQTVQAVGEFRREAALGKADYAKTFVATAEAFPFGTEPVLVSNLALDVAQAVPVLTFQLKIGQNINLSLNHDLAVAINKLLTDVLDGVDWGVGVVKDLPVAAGNSGEKRLLH